MKQIAIDSLLFFAGGCVTLIVTLKAYFKEHSIGKSALQDLKNENKELKDELKKVQKQLNDLDEDVNHNTRRIDKLIDRLIEKTDF